MIILPVRKAAVNGKRSRSNLELEAKEAFPSTSIGMIARSSVFSGLESEHRDAA
jgi:hypothetical protein